METIDSSPYFYGILKNKDTDEMIEVGSIIMHKHEDGIICILEADEYVYISGECFVNPLFNEGLVRDSDNFAIQASNGTVGYKILTHIIDRDIFLAERKFFYQPLIGEINNDG